MSIKKDILGLSGPSGIGKGFAKHALREAFPGTFAEPVVVTTRARRPDDSIDRLSGIDINTFQEWVSQKRVVFSHQPFGSAGAWYGFLQESFLTDKPLLTEVHPQNIRPFRNAFDGSLVLIGLTASPSYLSTNLEKRATETPPEREQRIAASLAEIQAILSFYGQGIIDHIIKVTPQNREVLGKTVVSLAIALLSLSKSENI